MQHDEIKGFTDQTEPNKRLINANKESEERIMRVIDSLLPPEKGYDARSLNLAKTNIQQGFMWLNRAIFQPQRVDLPEDKEQ